MNPSSPLFLRPGVFEDSATLVAGFSTRVGGCSAPPNASLNLSLSVGDDEVHVRENRRRLFEGLGFSQARVAYAGQVHGADIKVVDAPGVYRGYDGLVTYTPGLLLCISAADCASVLLADAEAQVVGACHAGWRGAVARIVVDTVAVMKQFGAVPERLRAYVSPCISTMHFEVGPEVAAQFDPAFVHLLPGWPKPHVDLKGAIAAQLAETGVAEAHIEVSSHCTVAETDTFFSHRAEHGRTGRMMGFIGMQHRA